MADPFASKLFGKAEKMALLGWLNRKIWQPLWRIPQPGGGEIVGTGGESEWWDFHGFEVFRIDCRPTDRLQVVALPY